MKTNLIKLLSFVLLIQLANNLKAQETKLNFLKVPSLTVNYSNLKLVDSHYENDGMIGELYEDGAKNQLFIVKEILKTNTIEWQGTKDIQYDPDGNITRVRCSGTPTNCKGRLVTDDNGNIISGQITIIH